MRSRSRYGQLGGSIDGQQQAKTLLIKRKSSDKESRQKQVEQALGKAYEDEMSLVTLKPVPKSVQISSITKKLAPTGVLGWAHPMANDDDDIYLLASCTVPVILRRQEDFFDSPTFRVIGDACIHGAQNGQLWSTQSFLLEKVDTI